MRGIKDGGGGSNGSAGGTGEGPLNARVSSSEWVKREVKKARNEQYNKGHFAEEKNEKKMGGMGKGVVGEKIKRKDILINKLKEMRYEYLLVRWEK